MSYRSSRGPSDSSSDSESIVFSDIWLDENGSVVSRSRALLVPPSTEGFDSTDSESLYGPELPSRSMDKRSLNARRGTIAPNPMLRSPPPQVQQRAIASPPSRQQVHPDSALRTKLFDALDSCGYLDLSGATLSRWAAWVAWEVFVHKLGKCQKGHNQVIPPGMAPPTIIYQLFAFNALLPKKARESATTRSLITLYAISYIASVPFCVLCGVEAMRDDAELDIDFAHFGVVAEIEKQVMSRMVIGWATAVRLAVAWLVDEKASDETEKESYWLKRTRHVPPNQGASLTTYFQKKLGYHMSIPNERLMRIMKTLVTDYPLANIAEPWSRYSRPRSGILEASFCARCGEESHGSLSCDWSGQIVV